MQRRTASCSLMHISRGSVRLHVGRIDLCKIFPKCRLFLTPRLDPPAREAGPGRALHGPMLGGQALNQPGNRAGESHNARIPQLLIPLPDALFR